MSHWKVNRYLHRKMVAPRDKRFYSQFMKKYWKVCKRLKCKPLTEVRVQLPNMKLELITDNINIDDWLPILQSISCDKSLNFLSVIRRCQKKRKYLKHVNTESKARKLKVGSLLCSSFMMDTLTNALSKCVSGSNVLTSLHIQNLILKGDAINNLCLGLVKTTSLQDFSLHQCPIKSQHCQKICEAIKNIPTINSLELRNCDITPNGMAHIAELLKFQQTARTSYWCNIYVNTTRKKTRPSGLQRLNLSQNKTLGDEGLEILLQALMDNNGIKAVIMKNCGISTVYGKLVLELVQANTNLVVFDLKNNPDIDDNTLKNLKKELRDNCVKKLQLNKNMDSSLTSFSCETMKTAFEKSEQENNALTSSSTTSSSSSEDADENDEVEDEEDDDDDDDDEEEEEEGEAVVKSNCNKDNKSNSCPKFCNGDNDKQAQARLLQKLFPLGLKVKQKEAFHNPFTKISEHAVQEFVEKMRQKASGGVSIKDEYKPAYDKIMDGSLQELVDCTMPGTSDLPHPVMITPFGKASEISVNYYINKCMEMRAKGIVFPLINDRSKKYTRRFNHFTKLN